MATSKKQTKGGSDAAPRKDKAGHQDNRDPDRMHARENAPGDREKASRPYRAKDAQKDAPSRRSNPDRERGQR